MVKYPKTIAKDITSSFISFDTSLMALFVVIFFLLIFIQPIFLWHKATFSESAFVLYRIMFKEADLKPRQIKSFALYSVLFLYCFLVTAILEQNNNSHLVVSDQVHYYDNLDDIFKLKQVTPHLLKNNYVTDYFQFSHGDVRKREVYDRAKKCNCFHDTRDLLTISIKERLILSTLNTTSAFIFEGKLIAIKRIVFLHTSY